MCVNLRNRHRDHAHSGRRARSVRRPRRWLRPFIAPAVAPTPPGDGPGPVRAAPLPSARVVVVVGSCDVAPGPMQLLGWCASTAPPASTALPSRPPGAPDHGWGRAEEWPRPRPVPPPERLRRAWGESRRRRGLDHGGLADSEGSPRPAPSSGPAGGPNHPIMGPGRSRGPELRSLPTPETRGARHTHPTQEKLLSHQSSHPCACYRAQFAKFRTIGRGPCPHLCCSTSLAPRGSRNASCESLTGAAGSTRGSPSLTVPAADRRPPPCAA